MQYQITAFVAVIVDDHPVGDSGMPRIIIYKNGGYFQEYSMKKISMPYKFEGGDMEIVAEVRHEMAVARDEIIELDDSDDDSDNDSDDKYLPRREVINLCSLLGKACINYGDLDSSLELPHHLRSYSAMIFLTALNRH